MWLSVGYTSTCCWVFEMTRRPGGGGWLACDSAAKRLVRFYGIEFLPAWQACFRVFGPRLCFYLCVIWLASGMFCLRFASIVFFCFSRPERSLRCVFQDRSFLPGTPTIPGVFLHKMGHRGAVLIRLHWRIIESPTAALMSFLNHEQGTLGYRAIPSVRCASLVVPTWALLHACVDWMDGFLTFRAFCTAQALSCGSLQNKCRMGFY